MKKNLLYSTLFKICLLVAGMFFTGTIFAQTIGNGQTLNASNTGANVTIQAGGTLNMDVTKSFQTITTSGNGTSQITGAGTANVNNTLTIGASNNLEITATVVTANLVTTLDNNQAATLSGNGSLSAGTVIISAGNNDDVTLSISAGFTLQAGNINGTGGNGNTEHIISTNGLVKISGTLTGIDDFNCNNNSTVEFNGGNQAVPNYNYYNLTLAGTGAKSFGSSRTITGNFLLENGTSLSLDGSSLTINANGNRSAIINGRLNINGNGRLAESQGGTKTLVIGAAGYIDITDNTSLPFFNAYNFSATSTVEYGANDDQDVADVPSPGYGNLIISGNSNDDTKEAQGALDIRGDLTISAGTFDAGNSFFSGKTHTLKGSWIRNGGGFASGSGTGRIVFNGASTQTIGGTQPTTFDNITFGNTNGGITLAQPTTVTGDVSFTSGIVTSDATNLLIFANNATSSLAANSANTSSYVDGPVKKIGNDDFTFPVGKAGTGFVPIRIEDLSNNTGNTFTAEYIRATPPSRTAITAPGIDHLSKCEYWVLDRAAGTTSAADVTGYWNANSPCDAGPYVTEGSSMRLVHYNGTSWNSASTSLGTGNSGSGSVTWNNVSSFSPFALGTTSATENTLPVVFGDVKAYEKNAGVQIEWSNLTEKDVAGYTIERSANGRDFSAIGQQLPTSNQDDKASYTAFDATPNAGANYYRIKAAETTGKIVYSKVLSVSLGQPGKGLNLYPNPVSGNQLTLSLSNVKKGQYNLRVVNMAGQDVYQKAISNQSSSLTQTVDLPSSIKPGVYNMIVTGIDFRESKTFILQ